MSTFTIDVARRLRFIQEAALQPGGNLVAYTLRLQPEGRDDEITELWWHDLRSGASTRVEADGASFGAPAWNASGDLLAVRIEQEGRWRLALLAPGAVEAAPRVSLPGDVVSTVAWHGDARLVLAAARAEDLRTPLDEPYRVTGEVWEADGIGRVDRATSDLWELRLDEGDALRRLTDTPSAKAAPAFSPSGSRLLYLARGLDAISGATLRILDLAGGVATEAVAARHRPCAGAWRGETGIVFAGMAPGAPSGTQEALFVVDLAAGGEPVNRTAGLDGAIGGFLDGDLPVPTYWDATSILVDADGTTATVRAQVGGTCEVRRIALEGPERAETLLGGERACHPFDLEPGGRLLALVASSVALPDLALAETTDGTERQLTAVNADVLSGVALAPLQPLLRYAEDGLDAWFAAPTNGDEGPWPTVAILHGGPHAANGELFHTDAHLLQAEGFGVVMLNYRGSTGYDSSFGTALNGRWAAHATADVLRALDAAIARGWADAERLGVHGQSAGGTLTAWLTSRTSRFKAAVPENPAANFASGVGTCDISGRGMEDTVGPPDPGFVNWYMASPVADAHRCTTPTLVIQAEGDRRCAPEQGEQLYRLLRVVGCEVEMLRIPGGSHDASVLGTPAMRHAQEAALVDWFNRHLKG